MSGLQKKQMKLLEDEHLWAFDDFKECNRRVQEFADRVEQLRNEFKIENVLVVVRGRVRGEGVFITDAFAGDDCVVESMAAWALGKASEIRQRNLRLSMEQGGKFVKQMEFRGSKESES